MRSVAVLFSILRPGQEGRRLGGWTWNVNRPQYDCHPSRERRSQRHFCGSTDSVCPTFSGRVSGYHFCDSHSVRKSFVLQVNITRIACHSKMSIHFHRIGQRLFRRRFGAVFALAAWAHAGHTRKNIPAAVQQGCFSHFIFFPPKRHPTPCQRPDGNCRRSPGHGRDGRRKSESGSPHRCRR